MIPSLAVDSPGMPPCSWRWSRRACLPPRPPSITARTAPAERGAVALGRAFASRVGGLDGVRGLFTARAAVTGAEFRAYAAHLLSEQALTGVSFGSNVPAAQRAAYERRIGRRIMEPTLFG